MANPVKWGIISTADINRKVIPGAHASDEIDLVAVASRDQATRRRVRAALGDPARLRHVRGAARRPGDRGGLHLAAEHDALRLVDPGARGGQARALREAALAASGRSGRRLRHGRPHRPAPERGVHVPPQPTDEARCSSSSRTARSGELRLDPLGVQLLALRPRQHPPAHRCRRRCADGRRLLQRERLTPARW